MIWNSTVARWATALLVGCWVVPSAFAAESEKLPASQPEAKAALSASPQPPWTRVVILGASASAGFTVAEPLGGPATAQYRLNRYVDAAIAVPHGPIQNLASTFFFLDPESEAKRQVDLALERKPTLVLAVDFLFWLCYGEGRTDADRLKRFEQGIKLCESFRCPLVLGDIPDASSALGSMLSMDEIPTPKAIAAANQRLRAWARDHTNVSVLPLSNFMANVLANRPVSVHGHSLPQGKTRFLLQNDKLHPSASGCAVLALMALDAFQSQRPTRTSTEIRWDLKEVYRLGFSALPRSTSTAPQAGPSGSYAK